MPPYDIYFPVRTPEGIEMQNAQGQRLDMERWW